MKLDGLSMDLEKANMEKLRSVFPECFSENKLDIDKLLSLCGEYIDNDFEKYKFEWHGKAESLRLAQKRSTGTLRPCPEESVNFDTTQNLYIEGDNLEVLKLLQTSYYRKVKMIYIDPPYNTGNDFVYEDDFADPMARYKEVTQQTTKSNPETMGRYHTNWLNMMYPRLRLAANLLRDDGVIFISIDDNEVTNLRKLCDEVFGEENIVGTFTWQSKKGGGSDNNTVVRDQEYVLCYGKSIISGDFFNRIILEAEPLDCEDEHGQFRRGRELNKWGSNSRREDRPTMFFPIPGPNGEDVYPIRNDGTEGCWRWGKENMLSAVKNGDVEFSLRDDGTYIVYEKIRTTEPRLKPYRTMLENVGATADGSKLIKAIFDDLKIFDFPKPIDLIKKLLEMGSSDNDIILDFFSGSATTAHAVMQLNAEDGGSRKFICVQFPELCDEKSEAYKAGYRNICEIGKERIRRAGAKIISNKEQVTGNSETIGEDKTVNCNLLPVNSPDVGFKVFKLDTSNIKLWDGTPVAEEDIQIMLDRMNDMIDSIKNDRTDMDVVYEIMLKMGVPLTYPVKKVIVNKEQLTGNSEMIDKNKTVNCNLLPVISTVTCYSVGEDNLLMICLDAGITTETIEQLADYAPAKIVIAESCFADVSAMRNAHYVLRDRKIELKLV